MSVPIIKPTFLTWNSIDGFQKFGFGKRLLNFPTRKRYRKALRMARRRLGILSVSTKKVRA